PAPSSTLPLPPPPAGRAPDAERRVVAGPSLDGALVANDGEAASLAKVAPARERTGEVDATHGGPGVARSSSGSRLVEASWDQVNAALRRGDRALAEDLLERLAARPGEGDAARLSLAQLRFGRGDSAGAKRLVEVLSRSSADPVVRERALSLLMKIEMARAAAP
ncbi:MAG TPA: hypothetical protein VLC09_09400, partial [Polyangiaceae bacterium]|nr:hypothetical protein [Polyangiaceae bacterium]